MLVVKLTQGSPSLDSKIFSTPDVDLTHTKNYKDVQPSMIQTHVKLKATKNVHNIKLRIRTS